MLDARGCLSPAMLEATAPLQGFAGHEEMEAMTGARFVKTSGVLLLVGGFLLAVMNVVTGLAFPGDTAGWAGGALILAAILGIASVGGARLVRGTGFWPIAAAPGSAHATAHSGDDRRDRGCSTRQSL